MSDQLTLPVILIAALVDSVNPCAIGVLVLLLTVLLKHSQDKARMIKISTIYIFVVFVVYLIAGLGLITFQAYLIQQGFAAILGTIIGIIVIILGVVDVKDFFWYGKGFSLQIAPAYAKKIKEMILRISSTSAVLLGAFVALVELPCTGGPYLAVTTLLANNFSLLGFIYLIIYNFIFVLPLIILSALAFFGVHTKQLQEWKNRNRRWMRLSMGSLMIGLGVFLIMYYR